MAGLRAEGEAAGQRGAEAEKAAPPQRHLRAGEIRENSLLRNGSGRTFSSPAATIAASFRCFFEPVSTFANLVNAK